MFIVRFVPRFLLGISLIFSGLAVAQTAPPAQAPPSARAPQVNAPLGEIPRLAGDGNGAYKTREYRDLFAELGHSPAESHAKIEKAFSSFFMATARKNGLLRDGRECVPPDHPWPSPNDRRLAEEAAKGGKPLPFFRPTWDRVARPQTIGPMVDEEHCMIRSIPNVDVNTTDASYFLPAFYELWARWGPPMDREFWATAADVSREMFNRVTGPQTGLAPDRSNFDGTEVLQRDGTPTPFSYDSWRTVSNSASG